MNCKIATCQLSKAIRYFLFIFTISFFVPNFSFSQHDLYVDDYVFICEKSVDSIESNLLTGSRSFVLDIEEVNAVFKLKNSSNFKDVNEPLEIIQSFLKKNEQTLISLIFKGEIDKEKLIAFLETKFSEGIYVKDDSSWPKINDLAQEGIQVLCVFESDIASSSIEQVRQEKKYESRFSSNPENKLILFESSTKLDSIFYNDAFELWTSTGKAPNFIVVPQINKLQLRRIADSLTRTRRFKGVINYNEEPLSVVSWKNLPHVITPSKFSFPLLEEEMILSPYKNGYRITPAEVIHHSAQNDATRVFSAYDVVIEDKLVYDFSFENNIKNTIDLSWDRSISKDVSFISDADRGRVLHFRNNDSYVDYSKENILDFKTPISVSVWIKPDSIPEYMGIVSFGMAFSFKLRNGNPDFTMATVKDHILQQKLQINKWQHLVVIFNPKAVIEFFLDGEKVGEVDAHDIIPSKQSLVIGNNIWGEQFYGAIDDLKIWDRGLSLKEVEELFNEDKPKNNDAYYVIFGLLVLVVLGLMFAFKRRKRTSVTSEIYNEPKLEERTTKRFTGHTLRLFGNFYIDLNSENKQPPSFSPLNKELLSFILLSVLEDKDGVSTNKLTDTFWPGVSKLKAKENRNGNIGKLRKVLSHIDGLDVVFNDNKWQVKTSENFEVDILKYKELKDSIERNLNNGLFSSDELNNFLDLLKRGNILQNTQTEWVDYFKNKISNEIESVLSRIYISQREFLPSQLNIKLAETILLFDNLNENALKILINELILAGKHGLAKNTYSSFSKNYKTLYGEAFGIDYQDFVKN